MSVNLQFWLFINGGGSNNMGML